MKCAKYRLEAISFKNIESCYKNQNYEIIIGK